MKKLAILAIVSGLCLANNGSCIGGGVNSASAAHACQVAITASTAAQDIAAFFIAHGWEVAKAEKVANAIRTFQLPVEAGCALLAPAPTP